MAKQQQQQRLGCHAHVGVYLLLAVLLQPMLAINGRLLQATNRDNDHPVSAPWSHVPRHQEQSKTLTVNMSQQPQHQATIDDFKKERDKNATATMTAATLERSHNRGQLRLQQLQQAQHHHLRHEQHLRAELRQQEHQQEYEQFPSNLNNVAVGPLQQHHLRHHNRHHEMWEQRMFPGMYFKEQLQNRFDITTDKPKLASSKPSTTTTATSRASTTDAPAASHQHQHYDLGFANLSVSRYFDRDGIYAWADQPTTVPPKQLRLSAAAAAAAAQAEADDDEEEDEDYDEEDYDDDDDNDSDESADVYSDVGGATSKLMPRYSLFEKPGQTSNNEQQNRHPSVAESSAKIANKRHLFDFLFKKDRSKPQATPPVETPRFPAAEQHDKNRANAKHDNADSDNADDSDYSELADDDAEVFSNDKWNRIEHAHHVEQQKHQKELQALRESSRNTPLIRYDNEISAAKPQAQDNYYARNHIGGKLTQQKVEQLGTSEAVKKTHRQAWHQISQENALANDHFNKIMKEATCAVPQPRCERIQRETSKIYSPHCTVLHRCSEDSGCCHRRTEICAPKRTRNVELYFLVKSNNQRRTFTEKLTFVNHTECHCIERAKFDEDGTAVTSIMQHATILSCNCPNLFEKILQEDGHCRCDCSSGNTGCDGLKRGSEHFSMNDRKCIQHGRCKPPTCAYGSYLEKHGRCPKPLEQQPSYNVMS